MPRRVHRTIQGHLVYTALLSIAASSSASAQDANTLDCSSAISIESAAYNLAPLSGEKTVTRTRVTPPSTMEDEFRFDICKDLARKDGVADGDQCPTGTRACLTKINKKPGMDSRIIAAIPVAQTSNLQPAYSALQSPAGLSLTLHGGTYPPDSSPSAPQSLNLTLLCTPESSSEPNFVSYENGVVSVEWSTSAGCPTKQEGTGNDGDSNSGDGEKKVEKGGGSSGGSGIGWFFLFLFFAFVGYFALGAYYNYNNFGATGWDLVPHRDFWRDVPYLLRDFTEHLCSTLRPGRSGASRRGYMAV